MIVHNHTKMQAVGKHRHPEQNIDAEKVTRNRFRENCLFHTFTAFLLGILALFMFDSTAVHAQSGTLVGGKIDTDTTWRQIDSPYVFSTTVTINKDVILTIEPGTIVKLGSAQRLLVIGALDAVGTGRQPILFTSAKDDSAGGDTNGDGAVTAPSPNDWGGILGADTSTIQLEYVTIRYPSTGVTAPNKLSLHDSLIEFTHSSAVNVSVGNNQSSIISILRSTFRDINFSSSSSSDIAVTGETESLSILNNTFTTRRFHSIELTDVNSAQISGNQITHNGTSSSYSHAIDLANVTADVQLTDNTIAASEESDAAGIRVKDGTPTLTDNTVSNFQTALLISGGYPTIIPTLSNNDFENNQIQGIGVSGNLENGTWITDDGKNYFLYSSVSLSAGLAFTIPAGTIIKSLNGGFTIEPRATLNVIGTEAEPIILTSVEDDTFGGDTNNDGRTTAPRAGSWPGITGRGNGTAGSDDASLLNLEHVVLRYAMTAINAQGDLNLRNSKIEFSSGDALNISPASNENPSILVERNTFLDNNSAGGQSVVYVSAQTSQPESLIIQNNTFASSSRGIIELSAVESALISGNLMTQTTSSSIAIELYEVTDQVTLDGNVLIGTDSPSRPAIVSKNSAAVLSNNVIRGFRMPIELTAGYPEMTPTYSGNDFTENVFVGVGVSGTLKGGTWTNVGGLTHFLAPNSAKLEDAATLTIPAGTVVKAFSSNLILGKRSTLNAIGTPDQPIIFTSIYDDSVGGATANDEEDTQPGASDWSGIRGNQSVGANSADSSTINLENVIMRYANPGIQAYGNLSVRDSIFEKNSANVISIQPVSDETPSILIERSTFRENELNPRLANIYASGQISQPDSLTIRDNQFLSSRIIIKLRDIESALINGNAMTQTVDSQSGIELDAATDQVMLTDNVLIGTGTSSRPAIWNKDGSPFIANNTIRGFWIPVEVNGGYPQLMPTYDNNDFSNNDIVGIGLSGILKEGAWSNAGGYAHLLVGSSVTIEDNATLTIPAGTIVKASLGSYLQLKSGAALNAAGTADAKIVFTSVYDDSVGENISVDASNTQPEAGNWRGIIGQTSNSPDSASSINLQHTIFRYARNPILSGSGNVTLSDSTVEDSSGAGVTINPSANVPSTVSVERTTIRRNQTGIVVSVMPSSLTLTNNAVYNNSGYGLNSRVSDEIDATGIWWGEPTGPTDTDGNPTGTGDTVNGTVNYASWLTAVPEYADEGEQVTPTPTLVPTQTPTLAPTPTSVSPTPTLDPTPTSVQPTPSPPPIATPENIPTGQDAHEADNDCSSATTILPDASNQPHTFHEFNDADWIKFDATAEQTYRIEVLTRANSVADVILEVYSECDGTITAEFEETFTPGVRLDVTATENGPFYLKFYNFDPTVFGADAEYSVSVRSLDENSVSGAIILVEGRLKLSDRLQTNIANVVQRTYQFFKESGYSDENIYYLATDPSMDGYDASATAANLEAAISNWAVDKVGPDAPLTIYLMDHGNIDKLYLDEPNEERVTPAQLNDWLTSLEQKASGVKTTIIVEACHAGSFIDGEQSISGEGRLVITSTNVQNVAYASQEGAQFSDRFLTSLREGYGISNSFWDARNSIRRIYTVQDPWIDSNGNGIPNEPADGAAGVDQYIPGVSGQSGDKWAPYIVVAEGPNQIINGRGTLRAEVRDNTGVARVWASFYSPSYESPTSVEELIPEDVPIGEFTLEGDDIYRLDYDGFVEEGLYKVALYAEDVDGLKARLLVLDVQNGQTLSGEETRGQFLPFVVR